MRQLTTLSQTRVVFCAILGILGYIGLMQSSFLVFSTGFFSPDLRLLIRSIVILAISLLFLTGAAKFGRDRHWLKKNVWKLLASVFAFGCLGLLKTISYVYDRRRPHFLTKSEITLAITALCVFGIVCWRLRQSQKKTKKSNGSFSRAKADADVQREIKTGRRPYVAIGIVFTVVLLIAVFPVLFAGKGLEALKMAIAIFGIYGVICWLISFQKITVAAEYITFRRGPGNPLKGVYFKDISQSIARVLAEPEHPIALDIFTHNRKQRTLRLPLKSFRKEDVAWLLSIPELKIKKTQ